MKSKKQAGQCLIRLNVPDFPVLSVWRTAYGVLFLLTIGSALPSFAQDYETALLNKILSNSEYANDWNRIKIMRSQGVSDRKIIQYLDSQAIAYKKRKDGFYKANSQGLEFKGGMPPSILASCSPSDIGAENGNFGYWTGETGINSTVPGNCTSTPFSAATLPVANRITLVPPPGTDPCADVPGVSIPLPSPLGGKYSIMLGNMNVPFSDPDGGMERIKYTLTVQPDNVNFVYQYALAVENPDGHTPAEMPYFDFVIVDSLGDTIPCSFQHYIGGPNIPGFQKSKLSNANCTVHSQLGSNSEVWYKPWTTVGVSLSSYIGKTVTIICTTSDCSRCGHFCYAYLDFFCGAVTGAQFCAGTNTVVLTAPYDSSFTYSWTPGGQTTDSITVNPNAVDTVRVRVHPPSGCDFMVTYALHVTDIKAGFSYSANCDKVTFSDNTTITGGTMGSWQWSFPGGNPSASTLQNPAVTYSASGTYTVTLTVTSKAGCTSTYTTSVQVSTGFTMTTKGDTICAGSTATLAVGIAQGQGPFTYLWSPSNSLNNATVANPLASPAVTTTYSVIVTNASGCKSNATVMVYVRPGPSAVIQLGRPGFSCEGYTIPVTFSGSSDVTSWHWDFGDGSQDPAHNSVHTYSYQGTYTIKLTVSNPYCSVSVDTTLAISDLSALGSMLPANVFTPDGNGKNDCFHPVFAVANGAAGNPDSLANALSPCVSLEIFDRWGIKIFESTPSQTCWDGKTRGGANAKEGTYYYIAKFGSASLKGYLELLR